MKKLLTTACVVALLAGNAYADSQQPITLPQAQMSIKDLRDKQNVTLQGTIVQIRDDKVFDMQVNNDTIPVKIVSGQSLVFKNGDKVTVTGIVDVRLFGLMGKVIEASDVEVEKTLGQTLTDAVKNATGVSLDTAPAVPISNLPAQGAAQIVGTVDSVSDAKDFTLKDSTGSISVHIQSDENVALAKGSHVTVTGYVNNGQLSKNFLATHINISSNTPQPHA